MVKTEPKEEQQKRCFIITPIGNDDSIARRETDGLIDAVVLPVLRKLSIAGEVSHRINKTGNINKQVITRLVEYDLVIANLTGLNPNVMYELAVRHAKRLPVVSVAEKGTKLPFDLYAERTLLYVNDMAGVEDLKPRLKLAIESALSEKEPDNPIYNAISDSIIKQVAYDKSTNTEKYILDKLDLLTRQLEDSAINPTNTNESSIAFYFYERHLKKVKEVLLQHDIDPKVSRIPLYMAATNKEWTNLGLDYMLLLDYTDNNIQKIKKAATVLKSTGVRYYLKI